MHYHGPMTLAENIVMCLDRATPDEIDNGVTWYPRAHDFARSLDNDVWRASGVIAALSAQKEWNLNMRMAQSAFNSGIATGNTGVQNGKAQRILDGNFNSDEILSILNGEKTKQFASAIALSGNSDIAVIDRHAYDAAVNVFHVDATRPSITKKVYARVAEAYFQAAIETGYSVAELQAIVWVTWKRLKGER